VRGETLAFSVVTVPIRNNMHADVAARILEEAKHLTGQRHLVSMLLQLYLFNLAERYVHSPLAPRAAPCEGSSATVVSAALSFSRSSRLRSWMVTAPRTHGRRPYVAPALPPLARPP
jgi:hypothetical protein